MKHYPPRAYTPRRHIPPFHPVAARSRHDGWTPERQGDFIGHLAETLSVTEAARRVGMARESAYRLRERPFAAGFRLAWDAALLRRPFEDHAMCDLSPSKVTSAELFYRVETGLIEVLMKDGRYAGCRRKADDSALLAALARLDRSRLAHADEAGVG